MFLKGGLGSILLIDSTILSGYRKCPHCGSYYSESCSSTHGCAGYSLGTIIFNSNAVCPGCGQ